MTKKRISVEIEESDAKDIGELISHDGNFCYIEKQLEYYMHEIDMLLKLDQCPVKYRLQWHFNSEMQSAICLKISRLRKNFAKWQDSIKE